MTKNQISTETIKAIAQATDKELFMLDYQMFSLVSRFESYAQMNERSEKKVYATELEETRVAINELRKEIKKLDGVYDAMGGWERYIIVPGGHIHNYVCSTLYATTQRVEAYMHSAEDVESLIEKAGDRACTVCFPDAPVDKPSTLPQYVKEREQRKAEAKAREEKKAKAHSDSIVDENGKIQFKTIRALTNEISSQIGYYVSYMAYVENFGNLFGHGKDELNGETREEYYGRFAPKAEAMKESVNGLVALAEANGHDVTAYVPKTFDKKVKEMIKECKQYPSGVEFPEGFTEKF